MLDALSMPPPKTIPMDNSIYLLWFWNMQCIMAMRHVR
jgi:hypothetical protein